jgi:thiol:disulfide interchange protein DsbA
MPRLFRRLLSLVLVSALALPIAAQANALVAGKDYTALTEPQPVENKKKVEVIEFFWYGCPHCNDIDPKVEAWLKTLPADVEFRREHINWGPLQKEHAKLYYSLKSLGWLPQHHGAVFESIHKQNNRLAKKDERDSWLKARGLDAGKFNATFDSFSIEAQASRMSETSKKYRINGVPTFVVNGKWVTSPSVAGSEARVFEVLNGLIAQERPSLKK